MASFAPVTDRNTVIALEGMPGAGKTTTLVVLRAAGHLTVDEHVTAHGQVIKHQQHCKATR